MQIKYLLLCAGLLILTACTADIGENCGGLFDRECITGNCLNEVCVRSDLGGKCEEDRHCNQGYCILNACRNQSEIGGFCEKNSHCVQGICKGTTCILGSKGDVCRTNDDCDGAEFECYKGTCASKKWYCGAARFFNAGELGFFGGLLMALLAIGGTILGIKLPGISVQVKTITIVISLLVLGISVGALGIGIFATCY